MRILESLPRTLATIDSDDASFEPAPGTVPGTPVGAQTPSLDLSTSQHDSLVDLAPELAVRANGDTGEIWDTLKVDFRVNSIALEVFTSQAHQEDDQHQHSIAKFALEQTRLGMQQLSDGAMTAEFTMKTLSFSNTKTGNSVHREIIPAADHDSNQV